jgi:membrane protein implicated in regulation of membrane protease activity
MWVVGGFVLAAIELATPSGFFIIFFGLAAITVGILARYNVIGSWWVEWMLFSVFSVAYLGLFRKRLQSRFQNPPSSTVDSLVGALAITQEPLAPGVVGRVEVRGSTWSARNVGHVALETGQRARVASVDGLTLGVVPE